MRTVYLGTSDFAAAVLERLADSPHRPALVVTRPDARRGRGQKVAPPPVAERARALGIEAIQPPDLHAPDAIAAIAAAAPEALVVCAYGVLIKEPLLSDYLMYNVHPSLLPRWRGAAPVERAIMAGDAETGVSIMQLTAELDSAFGVGKPMTDSTACIDVVMKKISRKNTMSTIAVMSIRSS